jgi:hypothetical protein
MSRKDCPFLHVLGRQLNNTDGLGAKQAETSDQPSFSCSGCGLRPAPLIHIRLELYFSSHEHSFWHGLHSKDDTPS